MFASTVVTGDAHGALLTEDSPLPVQTPYGRSKQEGERLVLESGLPAVVVRPSHVYGPGGWYAQRARPRLRQPGRFAVIGRGENLWDVVHVARRRRRPCVLAAEDAPAGSTYHVVDDEPITFYDFMALTAEALGVGAPRRIPVALARSSPDATPSMRSCARPAPRMPRSSASSAGSRAYPTAREGVADAVARLLPA